ncbi:MAG: hypothetical protein EH225_03955 [Calditrichaeota bacterium]|nr:MAG: hypothetical protein EH225_03955 [Calditrichota bacterium]
MKNKAIHELHYEQIALGELIAENDWDREKINKIRESDREILEKYPAELMARKIREKMDNQELKAESERFNYKLVYLPLSAVAVLLLFFTVFPGNSLFPVKTAEVTEDVVRLKGSGPSLYIYRGVGGDPELLSSNAVVREKDLLQISYDSAGSRYGVIFSIDGRGTVTLHFPENIYSSTRLDYGGRVSLPYSYELDNAPFFERFFFVTSENEIDASEIMEKAGRIAKGNKSEMLILPADQVQQSLILFKEEVE